MRQVGFTEPGLFLCSIYERKLMAVPSELPRRALAVEVRGGERGRGGEVATCHWIAEQAEVGKRICNLPTELPVEC